MVYNCDFQNRFLLAPFLGKLFKETGFKQIGFKQGDWIRTALHPVDLLMAGPDLLNRVALLQLCGRIGSGQADSAHGLRTVKILDEV